MRYKTTQEPSPSQYNLEVGDRWINPETGQESDWNGTAWGSTPEADPIEPEDTDGDGEKDPPKAAVAASAPTKPAAAPAKPKAASTKK